MIEQLQSWLEEIGAFQPDFTDFETENSGIYPQGVDFQEHTDICGNTRWTCQYKFVLRLVLPRAPENAQKILDLTRRLRTPPPFATKTTPTTAKLTAANEQMARYEITLTVETEEAHSPQ